MNTAHSCPHSENPKKNIQSSIESIKFGKPQTLNEVPCRLGTMLPLREDEGVHYKLHVHLICCIRKICLKKYWERCRALNRSSEVFPQQLKVPCVLQGVETLIVSVGIEGISKDITVHAANLLKLRVVRVTHLTLSEHLVMPWRENKRALRQDHTNLPHTLLLFLHHKRTFFFLATESLQPTSPFHPSCGGNSQFGQALVST